MKDDVKAHWLSRVGGVGGQLVLSGRLARLVCARGRLQEVCGTCHCWACIVQEDAMKFCSSGMLAFCEDLHVGVGAL